MAEKNKGQKAKDKKQDREVYNDRHTIPKARGNGELRRELYVDENGKVTRYNLAYINHATCAVDNGRVIGYDNAHNYHHRHYFGTVEPVEFVSFEDTEARFEQDWRAVQAGIAPPPVPKGKRKK